MANHLKNHPWLISFLHWMAREPKFSGSSPTPRWNRGAIMVLVLWTIVVMAVLASTLAFDVQVNSRLARLQRDQFLAYNLARSGIAAGMTDLLNDAVIDAVEDPERPFDGLGDVWAQPGIREENRRIRLGTSGPERARAGTIRFNTPTFEYEVRDEEGKIPLNAASPQLLQAVFEIYGMDPEDALFLAAAVADFRDADDIAQARDAAGMKENEYYSGLMGQDLRSLASTGDFLVRMPNEPFHSLDQLMDVPGFPAHLFYGFDPQDAVTAAALRNRVGDLPGSNRRRPQAGAGRRQMAPMRDIFTVRTFGTAASNRININTAPTEVITALLYAVNNDRNLGTARSAAQALSRYRGDDRSGGGMKREDAFKGPEDLAKVGEANLGALTALIDGAGTLGVAIALRSEHYEITGIGRIGNAEKVVTCWVWRSIDVFNPDDPRLIPVKEARRSIFSSNRIGSARSLSGPNRGNRAAGTRGGPTDNFVRIPAIRVMGWIE
jgi:type II secretory pathway component PulK